jgi:hypothetical protein
MLSRKSSTATSTEFETETETEQPRPSRFSRREVTHDQIARRAFEISQSGTGGSPEENWFRAERELRARA